MEEFIREKINLENEHLKSQLQAENTRLRLIFEELQAEKFECLSENKSLHAQKLEILEENRALRAERERLIALISDESSSSSEYDGIDFTYIDNDKDKENEAPHSGPLKEIPILSGVTLDDEEEGIWKTF